LKLDLGKEWEEFKPGKDPGPDGGDIPYHELDWPVYSMLPVADSFVDFRLWSQCYLRWIPVLDVRGGGHPPVYFHHCALVNDILSLESQLDKLHQCQLQHDLSNNGEADISSSPSQRFVTMSDHSPGINAVNSLSIVCLFLNFDFLFRPTWKSGDAEQLPPVRPATKRFCLVIWRVGNCSFARHFRLHTPFDWKSGRRS
jgi:hypothetical protein